MNLTNIQLGSNVAPGGSAFTANRYINAAAFKLVINGTGTNIFELTTGVAGATRRFAFASSGQYTMDAYGAGTFTGTATKWLAVTAAGVVIEEDPPTGATITADEGLTMSTATNVRLFGSLATPATLTTDRYLTGGSNSLNVTWNSVTTGSGFVLSSTSITSGNILSVSHNGTAAATGQSGINVLMEGANASSSLTTYGIFCHNRHTGGGNTTNVGVFGQVTNGADASIAVWGNAVGGQIGVRGISSTGNGGRFSSSAGIGLFAETTSGSLAALLITNPSSTNTIVSVARLLRLTSGSAAAGIGGSLEWYIENSSGSANGEPGGAISVHLTTVTSAAQTSTMTLRGRLAGADVDLLTLAGNASVKWRPITATAASAITPAEGMIVFTSDTDATFTAIGFWGYENGAWNKL